MIAVAVSGPASIRIATELGDGLFATEPKPDLVQGYRSGGGYRPTHAEVPLARAPDEVQAVQAVLEKSAWAVTGWKVMAELPNTVNFAAAASLVTADAIRQQFAVGPDPAAHLKNIQKYVDAGFDHIVLQNAGPDPDGFLDFFARELAAKARAIFPPPAVSSAVSAVTSAVQSVVPWPTAGAFPPDNPAGVVAPVRHTAAVLLTLTSTPFDGAPATDLGFLLHKHPDRVQTFEVSAGQAHVFYPEATEQRCTAALLLEVDPVGLVRGRHAGKPGGRAGSDAGPLAQYVNDRPYAASSMLAVALSAVFRSALAGRCTPRPELVDRPLPLSVHVPSLPCRGGSEVAERLFAPLGWTVEAVPQPLDPEIPAWGPSRYVDLRLSGELRVADALANLYVLLPVLDDAKHYWVSTDEVDKLVRAGGGWLAAHPERELIMRRYLAHRRELVATAVGRLAEIDDTAPEAHDDAVPDDAVPDDAVPGSAVPGSAVPAERRVPLADQRRAAVLAVLRDAGARRVVDLGCGEGALLRDLLADPSFAEVLGVDVSHRALELAARRLHLDRMPDRQRERVRLLQSSLTYRDDRLVGFDAAVLMEVVEHVDPPRLPALAATVFGHARPATVAVTTPNVEHNVRYADLPAGALRHRDHRFEWTRAEFGAWAGAVAAGHGYAVRHLPVGADDPEVGPPTQLAVFTREGQR